MPSYAKRMNCDRCTPRSRPFEIEFNIIKMKINDMRTRFLALCVLLPAAVHAAPGPPVCQVDPSGTYIEAENFTGTIVQGTATFLVESATPGFNGSGYLRSNGGGASGSPIHEGKIYNIDFTGAGWGFSFAGNEQKARHS